MIRIVTVFSILVSFCFFPSKGLTQNSEVLNLERCITIALEQNPEFMIAKKQLDKSQADIWNSYSYVLPQLSANARLQHAWKIQETTIPNFIKSMLGPLASPDMPDYVRIAFTLENNLTYGLSLNQPLFLGGAGIAGIKTAYAARDAQMQNLESQRQNLIYQSVDAFYGCLFAREVLQVQEETVQQAEANLDVVQKKYSAGAASGFEAMRAKVEVANRQPDLINARNQYSSALTRLRIILGIDPKTELDIEGALVFTEDHFDTLSLEELQNMAFQNRPEIIALDKQKAIAGYGVTIARSDYLPKLFFTTDYSQMANRNDLKFSGGDFSEGFTSALSLQIPIFSGFRTSSQVQKAKLDLNIVTDTERQLRDAIAAEVELAYNRFIETKNKYVSASETVNLAVEALRLANLMYDEGTNTQLDVLNSQLALTQSKLNYTQSLYEYQVSRYQLRKATGQLAGAL